MSALAPSDFIAAWTGRLQAAVDQPSADGFDGRRDLATWLAQSARDQAEHVFLILDATPIERRDLGEAERFVEASGLAILTAWRNVMEAFGSGNEPWAVEAAGAAARVYRDRLDELGPSLHAGGRA